MSKKQNTRRNLVESICKIYQAGMFVTAGFIVGFDSEKTDVGDSIAHFIDLSAIPVAMVGLLYALPNTRLTRRLAKEGRLHANHDIAATTGGDQSTTATSSHATTNSGGANQTQSGNNQQSAGKKSKGSGKTYLQYTFGTVFTTKVSAETKPKTKPVVTGTITHRKAGGTQQ